MARVVVHHVGKRKKQQYKKKERRNLLKEMLRANLEASSTFLRKTKIMKALFEKLQGNCKDSIPSKPVYHITASHPCSERGARPPTENGRRLHAFEQQKCVLEAESQKLLISHPDHIATGEDHSVNDHGQVQTPVLIPKAVNEDTQSKSYGKKEWDKLSNLSIWSELKVRAKADVIREAQNKKTCAT